MELLALIFSGIVGAAICYVFMANKSDDLQLALAVTKSDLAQSRRELKKIRVKFDAIRQLLDAD